MTNPKAERLAAEYDMRPQHRHAFLAGWQACAKEQGELLKVAEDALREIGHYTEFQPAIFRRPNGEFIGFAEFARNVLFEISRLRAHRLGEEGK